MKNTQHLENLKAIFLPEPLEAERDRGYLASIPYILKEIYIDGVYDRLFTGRHDLLVLDIGAHIGLWSMYASRYCKKIYAIEPSEEIYRVLLKNLSHNGYENVEPVKVAIANANTVTSLYTGGQNTTATLVGDSNRGSQEVECWTLPKLFLEKKIEHVDIMKLDVEGAEFGIFGGDHFSEVCGKIDVIVGEIHKWANRNFNNLYWSLKKRGYRVELVKHQADIFFATRI